MKAKIRDLTWLERLWLGAPVALWFSYQPLMRFGQDTTTYYELSLTLIYVVALALIGLPTVWRARKILIKDKAVQLTGAFVALSLISLFWTPNLTRGILTLGVIGLLYIVFLATVAEWRRLKKLLPTLTTVLVLSAVVMSGIALLQVVAGIWLPSNETLLCAGCAADQFGFVRPNGFAVEPQFLGSLLIAPLLILKRRLLRGKQDISTVTSFVLVGTGLFLTLSRGAIFAFLFGALVLIVLNWREVRAVIRTALLLIAAFFITLLIQGTAAALNPRVDVTFYGAVSASVNQLSLGIIRLPAEQSTTTSTSEAPAFNGYVKESTGTRLSLTQMALQTWANNPARMLFGVGLGGSGVAIHESFPNEIDAREIVQNEYAEILLEYGLAGLALFLAILAGFVRGGTWKAKWAWAFLAAYAVQWAFFSGYPNALHIYLVLIALYVGLCQLPANERRV